MYASDLNYHDFIKLAVLIDSNIYFYKIFKMRVCKHGCDVTLSVFPGTI